MEEDTLEGTIVPFPIHPPKSYPGTAHDFDTMVYAWIKTLPMVEDESEPAMIIDNNKWLFKRPEDAVAYRLKFGL